MEGLINYYGITTSNISPRHNIVILSLCLTRWCVCVCFVCEMWDVTRLSYSMLPRVPTSDTFNFFGANIQKIPFDVDERNKNIICWKGVSTIWGKAKLMPVWHWSERLGLKLTILIRSFVWIFLLNLRKWICTYYRR